MKYNETYVRNLLNQLDRNNHNDDLVNQYNDLLKEHGTHFHIWLASDLMAYAEHMDSFEDNFEGEYESLVAYVEELETELGGLGRLANHIDWESVALDYDCNGWYTIKTIHNTHLVFKA